MRAGSKITNCCFVSYRISKPALSSPGPIAVAIPTSIPPLGHPAEVNRSFKEKMSELVRLAREQGYLTRDEVHELFSDIWTRTGDESEAVKQLHLLDVQIVESLDVLPKAEPDSETEKHREAVDDLLRCYLTEIGLVPLLKPEQEQEIGQRMEAAYHTVTQIVARLGFGAKEHLAVADKLLCNPPKERFDRIVTDQKVASREIH